MDKRINWFIPPLILIVIIITVNIIYYKKRSHSLKRIVIKQGNAKNHLSQKEAKEVRLRKATFTKKASIGVQREGKRPSLAATSRRFAIQVASFRKKKRALAFVDSLKKDNYDAYIVSKDLGEKGTWYRVRIGNFSSKNDADNVLKEIKTKYLQSFITSYISP